MKMKPEIKKDWVEALRSGEYKQGIGGLKINDSYCCLGVLCDLAQKERIGEWKKSRVADTFYFFNDELETLPEEVVAWSGLSWNDPMIEGRFISKHNDEHKKTFEELADLIEKNL